MQKKVYLPAEICLVTSLRLGCLELRLLCRAEWNRRFAFTVLCRFLFHFYVRLLGFFILQCEIFYFNRLWQNRLNRLFSSGISFFGVEHFWNNIIIFACCENLCGILIVVFKMHFYMFLESVSLLVESHTWNINWSIWI